MEKNAINSFGFYFDFFLFDLLVFFIDKKHEILSKWRAFDE